MRAAAILAFLVLPLGAACSGDEEKSDAAVTNDAGADAGTADIGPSTPCGNETCTPDQYCQVNPTSACVQVDAGCAATEEPCQKQMITGCTTPRSHSCMSLPPACPPQPSLCPCLINQNLCPEPIAASCLDPPTAGATVTCPFP